MRFKEFVRKFITILEKSKIDYVIVRGITAIFSGEPRITHALLTTLFALYKFL